jgi:hypothetical protein
MRNFIQISLTVLELNHVDRRMDVQTERRDQLYELSFYSHRANNQ